MIARKAFCGIHFFIIILETSSTTVTPDYTPKVLNTENIMLTMEDFSEDSDNDLEIIKESPNKSHLDKKLKNFYDLLNTMRMWGKPKPPRHDPFRVRSTDSILHYPRSAYKAALARMYKDEARKKQNRKRRRMRHHKRRNGHKRKIIEKRSLNRPAFFKKVDRELEKEYEDFVAISRRNNIAYKYTDKGKPEENIYDAINKIVELNTPYNCTNVTGLGLDAFRCLVIDVKKGEMNKELIKKILIICLVLACIYAVTSITLWCIKGWCCCCFRCSICLPHKTIREIKEYLKDNPPGFYRDDNGKEERYHPSAREKELYEILLKDVENY